jgi:hypothetical protein
MVIDPLHFGPMVGVLVRTTLYCGYRPTDQRTYVITTLRLPTHCSHHHLLNRLFQNYSSMVVVILLVVAAMMVQISVVSTDKNVMDRNGVKYGCDIVTYG